MEHHAWLLTVKFDSCNNLSSVHTDCIILHSVKFDYEKRKYCYYYYNNGYYEMKKNRRAKQLALVV